MPIIANGGIETIEDVHRCLEETGCEGVMSSEGILENPQVFDGLVNSNAHNSTNNKKILNSIELAQAYLELVKRYPPYSFKTVRSHCMKFLFRYFEIHTEMR